MPGKVEVLGLKQAMENFAELGRRAQKDIGRESLRALGWAISRPMRRGTYTTFEKRTGAIRSGLGVHVQREPKEGKLKGYVEELPQSIAGAASPFTLMARKRLGRKRRRSVPTSYIAFYWRFLEFGTKARRRARTPSVVRTGKLSAKVGRRREQQLKSKSRWLQSANRGAIRSRSWLRPIFGTSSQAAVADLRETFKRLIDAAVSAMPKR